MAKLLKTLCLLSILCHVSLAVPDASRPHSLSAKNKYGFSVFNPINPFQPGVSGGFSIGFGTGGGSGGGDAAAGGRDVAVGGGAEAGAGAGGGAGVGAGAGGGAGAGAGAGGGAGAGADAGAGAGGGAGVGAGAGGGGGAGAGAGVGAGGGAANNADIWTGNQGGWEIVSENAGVCAMHIQLFPNNKLIMFDSTVFGPSQIPLPGDVECRPVPDSKFNEMDCWAHAIEYDPETAAVRTLKVLTDPWCSSGGLDAEGTLVQTGGWNDGGRVMRIYKSCDNCDLTEYPDALTGQRWYSTQATLADGSFILIGGRRMFNFEFVPAPGTQNKVNFKLPLLTETTDESENNLYPFVNLLPDGNIFLLANYRSVILNPNTKKVIRELPNLEGGARNYPGSASSALLPIDLNEKVIKAEILVCGGGVPTAFKDAEKKNILRPALQSCGRIEVTGAAPQWEMEDMPTPRVMSDMLILPNADILMLNGAKKGCSGWYFADEPNYKPAYYRTRNPIKERFVELYPSKIARMYHSCSVVLPEGKILVAGSNTNNMYNFTGVKFPTEMRVEKFTPPYLDPAVAKMRPEIMTNFANKQFKYGDMFDVQVKLEQGNLVKENTKITMYAPPFTTHGYSMNQRMLILQLHQIRGNTISVSAPPAPELAPPGYYLLFAVHRNIPSKGVWIKIR